jgi:hypothetical protein
MSEKDFLSLPGNMIFYQTEDGCQRIEVRLESGTVWLIQKLMSELFHDTRKYYHAFKKYIF